MRLPLVSLALATVIGAAATASAQTGSSPTTHIQAGDRAYAARNPKAALAEYEAAIAADSKNVDALWKASRTAAILGEFDSGIRDSLYGNAERYARDAVEIAPKSANVQFALAHVLGLESLLYSDPQSRLPYAKEVYHAATACLQLDPKSTECAHVLGVWNAEVMRTDEGLREMAISMLGATELSHASWANAQRLLLQAIRAEPKRAVHHFDLAKVYADMGEKAKAKAEYQAVLHAPTMDYNDPHYKEEAAEALKTL